MSGSPLSQCCYVDFLNLTEVDRSVNFFYSENMENSTFNVYIQATRYHNLYDVRIPEIFPEDCFEIKGAQNVITAAEECCKLALNTEIFNLQFFMSDEVKEELLDNLFLEDLP